jgi:hypothetical protein
VYRTYDRGESRFQHRRRQTHSTGERRVQRRCTLNGLMLVAVGTRTGLRLRTRRLQVQILPRVLSSQSVRSSGNQVLSGLVGETTIGHLAYCAPPQIQQGQQSGRTENDDLLSEKGRVAYIVRVLYTVYVTPPYQVSRSPVNCSTACSPNSFLGHTNSIGLSATWFSVTVSPQPNFASPIPA